MAAPDDQSLNTVGEELSAEAPGTNLPPVEPNPLEREAMMELVADGQRVLAQGRAPEALMMAESILETTPDFVPALALKGDSLERLGRLHEALAIYERVVELKPDSALDRIRASHLKKLAATQDIEAPEEPTRKQALLAAGAAAVLLFCVGAAAFIATRGGGTQTASQSPAPAEASNLTTFSQMAPVPTAQPQPAAGAGVPGPGQPAQQNPPVTAAGVTTGEGAYTRPMGRGSSRPAAGSETIPALSPNIPGQLGNTSIVPRDQQPAGPAPGTAPTAPPRGDAGSNPDPGVVSPPTKPEKDDPGIIEIRPSAGQGTKVGGSQTIPDSDDRQSAETLIRVARDAVIKGEYARAADLYERALRAGASRGSTNQRLAQCYEKLGRRSEAIGAYERAIASYQSSLASGGDSDRLNAAIEACRQAIRVLRGG